MLQASSSNFRPAAGAPHLRAIARRARPGRIDSRASRRANPHGTATPLGMGKEWAVIQQAIAGNADAQEHLFARHKDRLYRTAFSMLRNKEDAEDAMQDGLCKAYTNLRSFQGRSSFSTWLTRTVINAALMTRRKNNAHPEASDDEILESQPKQLPNGLIDVRPDPEKLCAAIEMNALVEEHARQLPSLLQTAFRLRATSGLSTRESSQALGIEAGAFKSRISRARRKLACALRQTP
jgi:RNA polymerase sigma-70 factor, ECF subfamily